MRKSKFKMGDKVRNLKTGNICSGTIAGFVVSKIFLQNKNPDTYSTWTKFYSDWQEKYIYFVLLDTPSAVCTLKQFIDAKPANVTNMTAIIEYQKLQKHEFISYPEDDLMKV